MRSLPLFLLLVVNPAAVAAQGMVQPVPGTSPGTSDADLLGATMRRVAANPLDVNALITAGEQSLKVDDLAGAASLFARAEKIDSRNGRIKAGMASILVRSERPGEALRYFNQAEAAGLDPRRFAADRGLAYDLIGEQERAQRDYRLVLQGGGPATAPATGDDETIRRYALSLGIAGRREEALKQLDPLLTKTDRAAWRARAFVLAMGDQQAEAERIATTMMPGAMAQGLLPFFRRLPSLPAADRAFAVHFGEVRPTPERLADARLVPRLTPIVPETRPVALVALAAVTVPAPVAASVRSRRDRQRRARPGRVQIDQVAAVPAAAAVVAAPVQVAALTPSPRPIRAPAPVPASASRVASLPLARERASPGFTSPTAPAIRDVAAAPILAAPTPSSVAAVPLPSSVSVVAASSPAALSASLPVASSPVALSASLPTSVSSASLPSIAGPVALSTPPPTAVGGALAIVNAAPSASALPVASTTTGLAPLITPAPSVAVAAAAPVPNATPGTAVNPPTGAAPSTSTSALPTIATNATRPVAPAPSRIGADSVLARIVASLSIPAEELGVTVPTRSVGVPLNDGAARTADAVRTKTARDAAAEVAAARLAARTRVADRKALAEKKAAADKKAALDKEAAEERRIARTNPARIWVQVAGGANERDLAKAWSAAKAKAPKVLGDRSGWTTPLRATNRVLTGPFKTDAEARSFVNQLSKAGVSAFTFSSDAGQSVSRLSAK